MVHTHESYRHFHDHGNEHTEASAAQKDEIVLLRRESDR